MRPLAWTLILLGIGLSVAGLGGALIDLAGLYSHTLADPMKDGPEGQQVSTSMLQWFYMGAAGVPVGVLGLWMRGHARLIERRRARAAGGEP